jgi:hypothetical protein
LKTIADPPKRDRWARLRFSIIGPLLAAPPGPRELNGAFTALAAKTWRHPETGLDVRFGASTLERWYYKARRAADPVAALRDRPRANEGSFPSLSAVAIATLTAQYREHPGWTAQLHLDNLRAACKAGESGSSWPVASYATVRRYLRAQGMHRQARPKRLTEGAVAARDRLEQLEVRSFEVEHVAALLHLDFHHASRKVLTRAGAWGQADAVGGYRRSLAPGVPPAVVPGRERAEPRARAVAGLHEARPAARADDRQRRGHAERGGHHRARRAGRRAPDDAAIQSISVCGVALYVASHRHRPVAGR